MRKILQSVFIILVVFVLTSCDATNEDLEKKGGSPDKILLRDALRAPENSDISDDWKIPETFNIASGGTVVVGTAAGSVGPIMWVINTISAAMRNGSKEIYTTFVGTGGAGFSVITSACAVLAIMFYGASIMLGIKKINAYEVTLFIIKILIAFLLATNWTLFESFVVVNVENIVSGLSGVMSAAFIGTADSLDVYNQIDKMLYMFLTGDYWKIVMATFVTGWPGFFYGIALILIVVFYVLGAMFAVRVYLIAVIVRALLYAIAPLYFTFLMFERTKTMFDAWVEQIINFTLQPVFLFAFLGMFQAIIVNFVNFHLVDETSTVSITLRPLLFFGYDTLIRFWAFCLDDKCSVSQGVDAEIPFNFWAALAVCIISYMMIEMADWCVDIAGRISGGIIGSKVHISGWDDAKASASKAIKNRVGGVGRRAAAAVGGAAWGSTVGRKGAIASGFKESIARASAGYKDGNSKIAGLARGATGAVAGAVSGATTGLTGGAKQGMKDAGRAVHEQRMSKDSGYRARSLKKKAKAEKKMKNFAKDKGGKPKDGTVTKQT